jgi:AAA+ ATPase superfamily predicted ATPase
MEATFVGRKEQLATMHRVWDSSKAALMILYGRRRVGKTRLLTHWMRNNEVSGIYWMAEATSAFDQLRSFSQALADFEDPGIEVPHDLTYPNWEFVLRRVARLAEERRMALFLDEATYLMDVEPTLVATLQKTWDQWLSKSNVFLALCGSQMGLMQRELISHDSPLYGRATVQMKLEPLQFGATDRFFPDYNARRRVELYSIWGGVPAYWERLDPELPVIENLHRLLLPSNSWLMDESRLLLQDFVNDPHNYVGVMRTIAKGTQTFSDIGRQTGLSMGHTSQYLSLLQKTGFVERRIPLTDKSPNSRSGRYFVTDPYLRFYYRFLAAYHSKLAMGQDLQTLDTIRTGLPEFIHQNTWPELCREWLLRASDEGVLPVPIEEVGGAWKRKFMVNVAGISEDEKSLVLGTSHWDKGPAGIELLEDLVEKTRLIVPRDSSDWSVYYVGFAANGWTDEAKKQAGDTVTAVGNGRAKSKWKVAGVRLLDLEEVDSDLAQWTS